jgi:hypothetical protein
MVDLSAGSRSIRQVNASLAPMYALPDTLISPTV